MMKIEKQEIHLWCVFEKGIQDEDQLNAYLALLSNDEMQRYHRFHFQKHRHQYLLSRALVREVLSRYQVLPAKDLQFICNKYGKPQLYGPGYYSSLHFNISHTDGLIVLAVSCRNEVGVDVEILSRKTKVVELAERYFSAQECKELKDLEKEHITDRFFDLWTLKESYIKACGMGLSIPLKDFSFSFAQNEIQLYTSPRRNDDPTNWKFWQIEADEEHKLALAIRTEPLENTQKDTQQETQIIYRVGIPLEGFTETSPPIRRQSSQTKLTTGAG
jgi:4'-phosphopantetheinyl transferase